MDYSKLSGVTDSLKGNKPSSVTVDSVETYSESPLDQLNREHIADDQKQTTNKLSKQVVLLDSVGLKQLASLSREQKRKFLARLTDSQRRRVLAQLDKIKDSGFSEQLGYVLLDDLLANAQFEPSDYNMQSLDKFVNTQEYVTFEPEITQLIEKVKNGTFDASSDASLVEKLATLMEPRKCRMAETVSAMNPEADVDSNVPESEAQDTNIDNEPVEELNVGDSTNISTNLPGFEAPITDSVDIADSLEHLTPSSEILDSVKQLADAEVALFLSKQVSASQMIEDSDNQLMPLFMQGYDVRTITDSYWSEFDKEFKNQFDGLDEFQTLAEDAEEFKNRFGTSVKEAIEDSKVADALKSIKKIIDDVDLDEIPLNDIDEKPFIDESGEVVQEEDQTPIANLLAEALSDYAKGEEDKLKALLQNTISVESDGAPESAEQEEPVENTNAEEPSEEAPAPEEGDEDNLENMGAIVSTGDSAREMISRLSKGGILKQVKDCCECNSIPFYPEINCEPTTCQGPTCTPCEPQSVPSFPLSHDEYQTICPPEIPSWIMNVIGTQPEVPPVESYEVQGNCINCQTPFGQQSYVPINTTTEDLSEKLKQAEENGWPRILGSACVTTDSLMNALAKCNLLNLIDSKFYKKRLQDCCSWSFDEVPECIGTQCEGQTFQNGSLECGNTTEQNPGSIAIVLFGIPYTVIPGM